MTSPHHAYKINTGKSTMTLLQEILPMPKARVVVVVMMAPEELEMAVMPIGLLTIVIVAITMGPP